MKKLLFMILGLVLCFALVSCGGDNGDNGGEGGNGGDQGNDTVTYTITVLNGTEPLAGQDVYFMRVSDSTKEFAVTGDDGKATFTAEKGVKYLGNVMTPEGMNDPKSFDKDNNLVITLESDTDSNKITYTIYVKNSAGEPVAGINVQICADTCLMPVKTDSEGKASYSVEPGKTWKAQITGEDGYYEFDSNNTVTIIK